MPHQTRSSKSNKFRRDAWVEVNLENLEYNLKQIYEWVQTPLMPVLKADAYGHGATMLGPILEAYDFVQGFGLASVDEAIALREAGIKKSLLVLGITPHWAFEAALKQNIELTIVDPESAIKLNDLAKQLNTKAAIHIKLDTGMNRIGIKPKLFQKTLQSIENLENIEIKCIFSHFAEPDNQDFSKEQLKIFNEATKNLKYKKHMASSAIAKSLPESRFNMVRCGIELYGLENHDLKPLMSLFARISFIKEIEKGESVSYNRTWIANKDSKIATLPLGYADGVPRLLSNQMLGFCQGQEIKQVGNITMDQLMFDISKLNGIQAGEIIELIGSNIHINDWSQKTNTISYELVTDLNLRLPKTYTRNT